VVRDEERAFRSKEHGIEKKRENLIPPIAYTIMGISYPFFLPNKTVLLFFLNPVEWMLTKSAKKAESVQYIMLCGFPY